VRKLLLSLIFFFAILVRLYNLASVPKLLLEKEVKTGLAAYGVHINTNDVAPLAQVFTTPFVRMFGLSQWSIRLPSVIASFATLIIIYFLAKELGVRFKEKNKIIGSSLFPIIVLLSFAISPWNIQIARVDTGINLGMFLFFSGIYVFLRLQNSSRFYYAWPIFLVASVYSDYSFFLPAIFVACLVFYLEKKRNSTKFVPAIILTILLLLPISFQSIKEITIQDSSVFYWQEFNKRQAISRISFDNNSKLSLLVHNYHIENTKLYSKDFTEYLEPNQLFAIWNKDPSYISPYSGLFLPLDAIFFGVGMFLLLENTSVFFIFLLSGTTIFIPLSMTSTTPNILKASVFFSFFPFLITFGFLFLYEKIKYKLPFLLFVFLFTFYFFARFLHYYFYLYPAKFADLQLEYNQAFIYTLHNFPNRSVVVNDTTYGNNANLYFLFLATGNKKMPQNYKFTQNLQTYSGSSAYISPRELVPQKSKIIFNSSSTNNKLQVSVFSVK